MLLILFLLVAPHARLVAAQATGTIAGTVVARDGGRPVTDATVLVDGSSLSAVANGVGRFHLDGVPAGQVTIVASGDGFAPLHVMNIQVRPGETTTLVIELELTPNILERVHVTATKSELSIGDVAAQTDFVERSTIDDRNDQSLVQAVAHVPGAVAATQLGAFESVQFRGLPRDDNEFTNTLLLIDGVPQVDSRNSARTVGLPIHDSSGIEVVRGPNSALYGRTAIGGSINVRTADPAPQQEFGGEFTGGQFGVAKGVVKASGPASTWGGYYVSGEAERDSGFYKSKTVDNVKQDRWSLFGKLTFAPDAKSVGFVTANTVRSDNNTPTNEPFIDGQLLHDIDPGFERLTSFNIPGPNYHHADDRIAANYMRQLAPWAQLTGIFGYRNLQQKFIDDGDFIGSPFDLDAQTVTMLPFSQQADEDIVYSEGRVNFTSPIGSRKNSLIVGGSYEHNSGSLTGSQFFFTEDNEDGFTINYVNPVIPPRSDWLVFDGVDRFYHLGNTGIFFQDIFEPIPRLVLTGAGRYDRLALDNRRGTGDQLAQAFDAFSPKLSATVKLAGVETNSPTTVNVYGTYSEAFLPPRGPSALTPDNVADNIKPENITNYEVGLKGSVLQGRVSFEATYFRMREEGVVLSIRQGPFFIPSNSGELKYRGVETGLRVAATPKLSLFVNASFYHNRFGDFVIEDEEDPGNDVSLTGNRLPIAPDHVVNWGAAFFPTSSINVTFDMKYVGDTATDRENTFIIPSYTLVDLAATWGKGPVRITLSGKNLFDEEYYWSGGSETVDPGSPRQVLVTTSFLFK